MMRVSNRLEIALSALKIPVFVFLLIFLAGCVPKSERISVNDASVTTGRFVKFGTLPGWNREKAEAGLAALQNQCTQASVPSLETLCIQAGKTRDAKRFFEAYFRPFMLSESGEATGLMTGYYEPLLYGSRTKSADYAYPLYAKPGDLLHIDLSAAYPELGRTPLRGRLRGGRVEAYPSRAQIETGDIDAVPICYVSDPVDLFFLHIQGSGRVQLTSGKTIFVGHVDRNGHPYRSIGKMMVEAGMIPAEEISMQSIRAYLKEHPEERERILSYNPSYIFFAQKAQGATGSLGVALTPMYSVAVDPAHIPMGFPLYVLAWDPVTGEPLQTLALAQDTGSAIKGQVRADLFWGYGGVAQEKAGKMKSPLRLWLLVPR